MSYSICLVLKNAKVSEKEINNEKSVIKNLSYYTQVEHVKIKGKNLYIYNQFNTTPEILVLDKYNSMFVNHYAYYSIKDLVKAYETITGAYKTISISKNAKNECNDIVAFNELMELMHSNLQDEVYGAAFSGVEFVRDYSFNGDSNLEEKILNKDEISSVINEQEEIKMQKIEIPKIKHKTKKHRNKRKEKDENVKQEEQKDIELENEKEQDTFDEHKNISEDINENNDKNLMEL